MVNDLVKKYGADAFNYFGGSPINRLSFLRANYDFLNTAFHHPGTRFVAFRGPHFSVAYCRHDHPPEENVLGTGRKDTLIGRHTSGGLHYLRSEQLTQFLGDPYAKDEDSTVLDWKPDVFYPHLVFLGIDESVTGDSAVKYTSAHQKTEKQHTYAGQAYFAVDLSDVEPQGYENCATLTNELSHILEQLEEEKVEFVPAQFQALDFNNEEAGIFAHARAYLDWIKRNPFCPGCGRRHMLVNGGNKLLCAVGHQEWLNSGKKTKTCPSVGTVTNTAFPRTDTVIIVAVISHDGSKILLGHNARFPDSLYTCVAGFIEPSECIEDAVKREVWEETGVFVDKVVLHSTQPWPYPANLMIGCVAQVGLENWEKKERINLDHDKELADARWFEFEPVRAALLESVGKRAERAKTADGIPLSVPNATAIAHTLIDAVVNRKIHLQSSL